MKSVAAHRLPDFHRRFTAAPAGELRRGEGRIWAHEMLANDIASVALTSTPWRPAYSTTDIRAPWATNSACEHGQFRWRAWYCRRHRHAVLFCARPGASYHGRHARQRRHVHVPQSCLLRRALRSPGRGVVGSAHIKTRPNPSNLENTTKQPCNFTSCLRHPACPKTPHRRSWATQKPLLEANLK